MTPAISEASIGELGALVAALPPALRSAFERIFHLSTVTGEVVPPPTMEGWIRDHFGSVGAVRRQRIVKVTNKVTLEGALFNELRSRRPIEAPRRDDKVAAALEERLDGPFCQPRQGTPADVFGRIRGAHAITAANVAKADGWHAVIIFDEHNPLCFEAEQVADYVATGQEWARAVYKADPAACYPFFLWNCLWRSGASVLHGHAQMLVTRGMAYARLEGWRRAAERYRAERGRDYFRDLLAVQRALGLALEHGSATILPSLTPVKERETLIVASDLNDDLVAALYRVLHTFVERLGVQSFNLVLYQPPLAPVTEDWAGFPYIFRLVDRGPLANRTSDVGAMELYAQSIVSSDPFRLMDALQGE